MRLSEWKLKLAVLWLLQPVNYVAYILIALYEAEPFGAAADPDSGWLLAVFFFVPCLMAWFSVAASKASRWPNLAFGAVFALLKLSAALGLVADISPPIVFNELWAFLAAGLVVWYAWKLPAVAADEG